MKIIMACSGNSSQKNAFKKTYTPTSRSSRICPKRNQEKDLNMKPQNIYIYELLKTMDTMCICYLNPTIKNIDFKKNYGERIIHLSI